MCCELCHCFTGTLITAHGNTAMLTNVNNRTIATIGYKFNVDYTDRAIFLRRKTPVYRSVIQIFHFQPKSN